MKNKPTIKILSLLLAAAMIFTLTPGVTVYAVEDSGPLGLSCPDHPAHDEACGYAEAIAGTDCDFTHEHAEDCGYDGENEESCAFDPASHTHDAACGFATPTDATPTDAAPCAHTCELCALITPLAATANPATYDELQAAVLDSTAGGVITLGGNISATDELVIGRDLTLDLAGKNLTIDLNGVAGRNGNGIKIGDGVTLTIKDSQPGENSLTVTNLGTMGVLGGNGAAINTSAGTLSIESGKVKATAGYYGAGIGGGYGSGYTGGTITISGNAAVTATGGYGGAGIGGGSGGSGAARSPYPTTPP